MTWCSIKGVVFTDGDHVQDPDADQDLVPLAEDEAKTHDGCYDQLISSSAC